MRENLRSLTWQHTISQPLPVAKPEQVRGEEDAAAEARRESGHDGRPPSVSLARSR